MAANIVSRSPLFLDSASARNIYLRSVKSHSESDEADVELAYGAGESEAIGFIDKPGGGSLELEAYRIDGTPEVDWHRLQANREIFRIVRADNGGRRLQYSGCRVASVSDESDEQGSHMTKIKVVWARREAL